MILAAAEERVELLRAGFAGKEIEQLYCTLNDLTVRLQVCQNVPSLAQGESSNGNK